MPLPYRTGYSVPAQTLRRGVRPSSATPSKVLQTTARASFGACQELAGAPVRVGQSAAPSAISGTLLLTVACSAGVRSSIRGLLLASWLYSGCSSGFCRTSSAWNWLTSSSWLFPTT